MQSYQLDLLDEKALVILRGLEQLRIITLKPLTNEDEKVLDYEITEPTTSKVDEPLPDNELSNFKKLRGSIDLGLTRHEIDAEVKKTREGWL